ncbi:MAG: hypothetical protein H0X14_02585 [Acidobacteria bacterium]|nr:hypothetical protein [Acidobacteriota bacterium]
MRAIDCQPCRNEIEHAALGAAFSAAALAHLESCARCRDFSGERKALRELVSSSLMVTEAPHDFEWRLRARLAADRGGESRPRLLLGFAPGAQAIAFAASFTLIIGIAVLLKQTRTERSPARLPVAIATGNETNVTGTSGGGSVKVSEVAVTSTDDGGRINMTNPLAKSRLRGSRAPIVKSSKVKTEMIASVTAVSNRSVRSNDFSSSAAPVITLYSVPLRAPSPSVKVLLDEGRGTMRTVSLQPVTFGSQAILERRAERSADEIW